MEEKLKIFIDQIALVVFALMFTSIQVVCIITIIRSNHKLREYERLEKNFVKSLSTEDSDDEVL